MIQITAQMRVLVAIEPVDGRKGIDSLARLCQEKLAEDPFSGCVFVFRSRSGTAIRLLAYDGQGYWLAQNQPSSHYTSFSSRTTSCRPDCIPAARSTKRSHRLQCFAGVFGPGGS
jgi:IS66 Orf2 like protein